MPASLESQIKKLELTYDSGLVTPDKRQHYAKTVLSKCVELKISMAMFLQDDPAASIRSEFNQQLHNFRRYPIEHEGERLHFDLFDDGTLEAWCRMLIRYHFDAYTTVPMPNRDMSALTAHRPRFYNPTSGDRVPVFHHTELDIVKAWYMEPGTCGKCGTGDSIECAPFVVLSEEEAEHFDLSDEQWQAMAEQNAA